MSSETTEGVVEDVAIDVPTSSSKALAVTRNVAELREASRRRWQELLRIRPADEVKQLLSHRGVPDEERLKTAPSAIKLNAMALFTQSFVADEKTVTFTESVFAKVCHSMTRRNFEDADYREFFFGLDKVLRGGRLHPLPPSLQLLRGAFFTVEGPSLCGKSAYVARLVQAFEGAFSFYGTGKEPGLMSVIPCLFISYPECGTRAGLLREIRYKIEAHIGRIDTPTGVFPEVEGNDSLNAVISLCLLVNVGILVIDGASFHRLSGEPQEILKLLVRLQHGSGIVVMLAGTPAFMNCVELAGSDSSNFFSGQTLSLGPLQSPLDKEGNLDKKSRFYTVVLWFWRAATLPSGTPMPSQLPLWMYQLTLGRLGWLVQVFEDLHIELIKKPNLVTALTYEELAKIARRRLNRQLSARQVVTESMERKTIADDKDFFNYIDHFPKSLLDTKKYRELLTRG
ncbi:hypothetical protein [Paraburkholderia xenovorans]|nr:hypothetical protein [Paraburkholderia xenovorans]